MCRQSEKRLLNSNISSTCPRNMVNWITNGWDLLASLGHPNKFQPVSRLAWLRYCTDVAQRRSTKLCKTFGNLLGWYTIYAFYGLLPLNGILPATLFTNASKSCVFLYWQRYCAALEQRPSVKPCGVVQGMELRNFRRRRHLYSAGRPSCWAMAHTLVLSYFRVRSSYTKT